MESLLTHGSTDSSGTIGISYAPDARRVEASQGETILEAALRAGIRLTHACGSKARCSTCRVAILQGLANCSPRTRAEQAVAGPLSARRLVLDDQDEELAVESMSDLVTDEAGEERHVAILFADIRGFTAFAEKLLPYDVIHALNRYYYQIARIVKRHGGIVDNYMGDGVLIVFGLDETERVVSRALQTGLEMLRAVEAMKPYFTALHGRSFEIGIGLHYGAVVTGSIGWGEHRRRTVVGDAVNFASRVEAANKTVDTSFLISDDAYRQAGHEVEVNRCPPWEIRGKTGLYQLYEVVGPKGIPAET
jgi:adenylate cyclase